MTDQLLGALDDDRRDLLEVANPVQSEREIVDRPQAGSERLDGVVQPGVADRRCHLVGEAAGEILLGSRPVADDVVIEDEEPEGVAPKHDRDETDARDAVSLVDVVEGKGLVGGRIAQDDHAPRTNRHEARRVCIGRQQRDPGDHLVRHFVVGGERERSLSRLVIEP